jgi:palmitoyl-protein thioesterase
MQRIVEEAYPGIYVNRLQVECGSVSATTHMDTQMEAVNAAIRADPSLRNGFNFYGESQGALEARVYAMKYNDPPVFNLVALNGPQEGVGLCPKVDFPVIKDVCANGAPVLGIYGWPACSFCSYWKDNRNEKEYRKKSRWLASVNNEGSGTPNPLYKKNMLSLNKYMVTVALQDQVVQPKESAHHRFWAWGDRSRTKIAAFNDTDGYKTDAIGLKTLYERGDMIFNEFNGPHTGYNDSWWIANVLPLFNTTASSVGHIGGWAGQHRP